jgi:3-phenylpropionate/trans-cinnamate dioxygenase ferredoxin subunit
MSEQPAFCFAVERDALRDGQLKRVNVEGKAILLCPVQDAVYAVENVCSHDGETLAGGELDGYAVECPRHGALFDVRDGRVLRGPATAPIGTFPVRVEAERVEVGIPPPPSTRPAREICERLVMDLLFGPPAALDASDIVTAALLPDVLALREAVRFASFSIADTGAAAFDVLFVGQARRTVRFDFEPTGAGWVLVSLTEG